MNKSKLENIYSKNLHALLKKIPIFAGIEDSLFDIIQSHCTLINLKSQDKLIKEKEASKGKAYIVISGIIIANSSFRSEFSKLKEYLAEDIINLMTFFDVRSTVEEAYAEEDAAVLCIDVHSLRNFKDFAIINKNLQKNIARYFTKRLLHTEMVLDKTTQIATHAIEQRLEESKIRISYGIFLIETIVVMCFYTLALKIMGSIGTTFIMSAIILIIITAFLLFFMKHTGLPLREFGLTTQNWKQSLYEGAIVTIVMLLIIILSKYFFTKVLHLESKIPLFEPYFLTKSNSQSISPIIFYSIIVYLIFVPVQEFIVRGVLQSSIYRFLLGRESYRIWLSILMSNFLFFTFHLHVSILFAFVSFLLGLVWGWLYARSKTLIGVTFSHFIVGFVSIFIINVEPLLSHIGYPSLFSH